MCLLCMPQDALGADLPRDAPEDALEQCDEPRAGLSVLAGLELGVCEMIDVLQTLLHLSTSESQCLFNWHPDCNTLQEQSEPARLSSQVVVEQLAALH